MKVIVIGLYLALGGVALTAVMAESHAASSSIYGHVTDLFGSPLSDAVVEITIGNSEKLSIRTKRDGSYLAQGLPAAEVSVVISAQGFRTETHTLGLQLDQQILLDFGLEPGSIADRPPVELSGTVQQSNKAPIKDATITVVNAFNKRLFKIVKTDSSGRYQIEFKDGGQYVMYASKPGFLVSTSAVVLPSAMPRKQQVNLVLVPVNGSIYGISQ